MYVFLLIMFSMFFSELEVINSVTEDKGKIDSPTSVSLCCARIAVWPKKVLPAGVPSPPRHSPPPPGHSPRHVVFFVQGEDQVISSNSHISAMTWGYRLYIIIFRDSHNNQSERHHHRQWPVYRLPSWLSQNPSDKCVSRAPENQTRSFSMKFWKPAFSTQYNAIYTLK